MKAERDLLLPHNDSTGQKFLRSRTHDCMKRAVHYAGPMLGVVSILLYYYKPCYPGRHICCHQVLELYTH